MWLKAGDGKRNGKAIVSRARPLTFRPSLHSRGFWKEHTVKSSCSFDALRTCIFGRWRGKQLPCGIHERSFTMETATCINLISGFSIRLQFKHWSEEHLKYWGSNHLICCRLFRTSAGGQGFFFFVRPGRLQATNSILASSPSNTHRAHDGTIIGFPLQAIELLVTPRASRRGPLCLWARG